MALDPNVKAAIEKWLVTAMAPGWAGNCPGCGMTGRPREASELVPGIVMLKCPVCGHCHVHDLELLKKKAGIS